MRSQSGLFLPASAKNTAADFGNSAFRTLSDSPISTAGEKLTDTATASTAFQ